MPFRPRPPAASPKRAAALSRATAPATGRRARARRALQETEKDRRGWLRHGIAALAVTGLGLGVAGGVTMTGSATESATGLPATTATSSAAVDQARAILGSRGEGASRSSDRAALAGSTDPRTTRTDRISPMDGTHHRAPNHRDVAGTVSPAAVKAAAARAKALHLDSERTARLSTRLKHEKRAAEAARAARAARAGSTTAASVSAADGHASLPVAPGAFSIAARFGQVGSWSRYHTGIDFAAPIGTPIHATADGVITNAGYGSASSWAGNYVVIKFADGRQMLFAHMSSVSVSVGQQVGGGQLIGHVGMTGRAFGPHTHVELYPAGVRPGDVYSAVDPAPWFAAHGLRL